MRWRVLNILAWLVLAATAIAYRIGPSYPRPVFLFAGIAGVLVLLYLQIRGRASECSPVETAIVIAAGLVTGAFLRLTYWTNVVAAGSDTVSHYGSRARYIMETGHILPDAGMYTTAPLTHVWIATHAIVLDLWSYDARFVAAIISALLPLFVGIVIYAVDDRQSALNGFLLSVPFPLVLRTGAQLEPEALALPWFLLVLYFLFRNAFSRDAKWAALFVTFVVSSSYIHYLYPIIILAVVGGGLVLSGSMDVLPRIPGERPVSLALFGYLAGGLFIGYRVLQSEHGAGLVGHFFLTTTSQSPDGLLAALLPTSGAVGQSTGVASQATIYGIPSVVYNLFPAISYALLAVIGGLYVLWQFQNNPKYSLLLALTASTAASTVFGLVFLSGEGTMAAGYRFYYYAGLLLLMFASVGLTHPLGKYIDGIYSPFGRKFAISVLCVMLIMMATLGPISSFGNNVDQRFGGESRALLFSDTVELNKIDQYLAGDERIHPESPSRVQLAENTDGPFAPNGDRSATTIKAGAEKCDSENRVWSGNTFTVCYQHSTTD